MFYVKTQGDDNESPGTKVLEKNEPKVLTERQNRYIFNP